MGTLKGFPVPPRALAPAGKARLRLRNHGNRGRVRFALRSPTRHLLPARFPLRGLRPRTGRWSEKCTPRQTIQPWVSKTVREQGSPWHLSGKARKLPLAPLAPSRSASPCPRAMVRGEQSPAPHATRHGTMGGFPHSLARLLASVCVLATRSRCHGAGRRRMEIWQAWAVGLAGKLWHSSGTRIPDFQGRQLCRRPSMLRLSRCTLFALLFVGGCGSGIAPAGGGKRRIPGKPAGIRRQQGRHPCAYRWVHCQLRWSHSRGLHSAGRYVQFGFRQQVDLRCKHPYPDPRLILFIWRRVVMHHSESSDLLGDGRLLHKWHHGR